MSYIKTSIWINFEYNYSFIDWESVQQFGVIYEQTTPHNKIITKTNQNKVKTQAHGYI